MAVNKIIEPEISCSFQDAYIFREEIDSIVCALAESGPIKFESNGYEFDTLDEIENKLGKRLGNLSIICQHVYKHVDPGTAFKVDMSGGGNIRIINHLLNGEIFYQIKNVLSDCEIKWISFLKNFWMMLLVGLSTGVLIGHFLSKVTLGTLPIPIPTIYFFPPSCWPFAGFFFFWWF